MTDKVENLTSRFVSVCNTSGLPTTIRGKAQRWLLRLIGGTVAAPIVQQSRETWDQVEGRSKVNMMIAEEVGRRAIADPDLMERAKAHFLSDTFRKQENVEAVAKEAVFALQSIGENASQDDPAIDEDWINLFARYAEDASSDRMRKLWGKVLAGEIRISGSYAPATMRIIAELDHETAQDFARFSSLVVDDSVLKTAEWQRGELFELASRLESAGLVTGGITAVNRQFKLPPGRTVVANIEGTYLVVDFAAATEFVIDMILLTRVGKQLLTLQELGDPDSRLERLANEFQKHGAVRAALCYLVPGPQSLFYERKLLFGGPNAAPPGAPIA